ncbi:NADH dehydrogenase [ubiquinone] iron-sulfur protein 5 [Varanus komodoensis]|uniref:NADH dehydrogenase [ubiquinone] iron-sulfur protein 5 n=1 Tax=Varanus komodoensis TaxID=61221 RepID=A0A8D2JKP7_VARKO|nr:NADH dehydrogenase [ubiquinone] iron-sulfur protein 5 [Varanus komodoensis]XP_044275353.1 NADH dehydrogenase [ubiquinone] iron-sulfur protein 5 [Varanus komodoensis]
MPLLDLQDKLGINFDRWLLIQSASQPNKHAAACHAFEKEWLECADGIGLARANRECVQEKEDLYECVNKQKMIQRMKTILAQKKKLMKEGKYTPPDYHSGKPETNP